MGAKNIRFQATVHIDFMYIEKAPVLHMVDDATHFSAAHFRLLSENRISLRDNTHTIDGCLDLLSRHPCFDNGSQFKDIL